MAGSAVSRAVPTMAPSAMRRVRGEVLGFMSGLLTPVVVGSLQYKRCALTLAVVDEKLV
ncbi:hypothetical protein FQZ97_1104320 [compost metagenome]